MLNVLAPIQGLTSRIYSIFRAFDPTVLCGISTATRTEGWNGLHHLARESHRLPSPLRATTVFGFEHFLFCNSLLVLKAESIEASSIVNSYEPIKRGVNTHRGPTAAS
jgi:hypothetical protein